MYLLLMTGHGGNGDGKSGLFRHQPSPPFKTYLSIKIYRMSITIYLLSIKIYPTVAMEMGQVGYLGISRPSRFQNLSHAEDGRLVCLF